MLITKELILAQEFLVELQATRSVDFVSLSATLVDKACSQDEFTRMTAIKWLKEFVQIAPGQLVEQYDAILGAVLPNISHSSAEIQQVRPAILFVFKYHDTLC